ncbi:hypothetical protein Trydic_g22233 [Trypoxylus dichotomus]
MGGIVSNAVQENNGDQCNDRMDKNDLEISLFCLNAARERIGNQVSQRTPLKFCTARLTVDSCVCMYISGIQSRIPSSSRRTSVWLYSQNTDLMDISRLA